MCSSNKWAFLRFCFLALFILTLLLSPGSANASSPRGSVTGIVRDATGSVVDGASVTLRNVRHHDRAQDRIERRG